MNEFLGRFATPIRVISFEVLELAGAQQQLIREAVNEPRKPSPLQFTVDATRHRAADAGVGEQCFCVRLGASNARLHSGFAHRRVARTSSPIRTTSAWIASSAITERDGVFQMVATRSLFTSST